ncbi:hypothetical protein RCL1_005961 [Eukaryota sp. TZLM3-RCL]
MRSIPLLFLLCTIALTQTVLVPNEPLQITLLPSVPFLISVQSPEHVPHNSFLTVSCPNTINFSYRFGDFPSTTRFDEQFTGSTLTVPFDACVYSSGFDILGSLYIRLFASTSFSLSCDISLISFNASISPPVSDLQNYSIPASQTAYFAVNVSNLERLKLSASKLSHMLMGYSCPLRHYNSVFSCDAVLKDTDKCSIEVESGYFEYSPSMLWLSITSLSLSPTPTVQLSVVTDEWNISTIACFLSEILRVIFSVVVFISLALSTRKRNTLYTVLLVVAIPGALISGDFITFILYSFALITRIKAILSAVDYDDDSTSKGLIATTVFTNLTFGIFALSLGGGGLLSLFKGRLPFVCYSQTYLFVALLVYSISFLGAFSFDVD